MQGCGALKTENLKSRGKDLFLQVAFLLAKLLEWKRGPNVMSRTLWIKDCKRMLFEITCTCTNQMLTTHTDARASARARTHARTYTHTHTHTHASIHTHKHSIYNIFETLLTRYPAYLPHALATLALSKLHIYIFTLSQCCILNATRYTLQLVINPNVRDDSPCIQNTVLP